VGKRSKKYELEKEACGEGEKLLGPWICTGWAG